MKSLDALSIVVTPSMSDLSTVLKQAEDGDGPITRFTSPSGGGERTVVEIASLKQELTSTEVEGMRGAFTRMYGEDATRQAFRLIDSRLGEERPIRGEHVASAELAALEFVSPVLQAAGQKIRAEDAVAFARAEVDKAQLAFDASTEKAKAAKDAQLEMEADRGWSPGLRQERETAEAELRAASEKLAAVKERLAGAEKTLERATARLEIASKALDQSFDVGEDRVGLERRKTSADSGVELARRSLDRADGRLESAKEKLRQAKADLYEMEQDRGWSPGLRMDRDKAERELESAKEEAATARRRLDEAVELQGDIAARLDALRSGPMLRRAQALLDHVGEDPRFTALMDKASPGRMTGGALGTAESVLAGLAPGKLLTKAATTIVAPVGIASLFYRAVSAEDRERRLGEVSRHLDGAPLAKGLARGLAAANEMEKWKLGIQGTLGFVGFAVSVPGASAMTAVMSPLTSAIGHSVVAHGASQLVGDATGSLVQMGVKKALDTGAEKGLGKLAESHQQGLSASELRAQLAKFELPEGSALPVIPVRPFGPQHAERILPLSDPEVATAFLAYLGPKADDAMLRNPGKAPMEERRLAMREELFGAGRDENLVPGKKIEGDPDLLGELDSRRGSLAGGMSPLHLLHAALGWTT